MQRPQRFALFIVFLMSGLGAVFVWTGWYRASNGLITYLVAVGVVAVGGVLGAVHYARKGNRR